MLLRSATGTSPGCTFVLKLPPHRSPTSQERAKRSLATAELSYWAWRGQPLRDVALQLINQSQGDEGAAPAAPAAAKAAVPSPVFASVVSVSSRAWDAEVFPASFAASPRSAAPQKKGGPFGPAGPPQAAPSPVVVRSLRGAPLRSAAAPPTSPASPRPGARSAWALNDPEISLREGDASGALWMAAAPSGSAITTGWGVTSGEWGTRENPEYDRGALKTAQSGRPAADGGGGGLANWVAGGSLAGHASHDPSPGSDQTDPSSREAAALASYEAGLESVLGLRLTARVRTPGGTSMRTAGNAAGPSPEPDAVPLALDRQLWRLETALTARLWYLRAGVPSRGAARGDPAVGDPSAVALLAPRDIAAATACAVAYHLCARRRRQPPPPLWPRRVR